MTHQHRQRPFAQVDVFSREPYMGNPVAVVLDGTDFSDQEMARFARWTNLSETTFVLPATTPDADYRLRIWTPNGELPFAGHPTLGSAHAWLEAGNAPHGKDIVQECAAGLISIRSTDDGALVFTAPPTVRSGELDQTKIDQVAAGLGFDPERVVAHQWVDNGPGWAAIMLPSAEEVLALQPDFAELGNHKVGVVGPYPEGGYQRFEVRAFFANNGAGFEDPVTGSLNASLAQWLMRTDRAPGSYVVQQGTRLGRRGLVTLTSDPEGNVYAGGHCTTCISGSVLL